jgi:hypothetical protein
VVYACPIWEYAADAHLLKPQRLQNRVLRAIGNFERRTPVREMHVVLKIAFVHDYILKLCRKHAEIIQNHRNQNVRAIGQEEAMHGGIRSLNSAVVRPTTVQLTICCFAVVK